MGAYTNFALLAAQVERFARLAALAGYYFYDDAPGALMKLRQLAEFMAKDVAARHRPPCDREHRVAIGSDGA